MIQPRRLLVPSTSVGFVLVLLVGVLGAPLVVQAGEGGDGNRQAAGGGHMSSYVTDPHHDPRSLHSQRSGTGQLLGSPMVYDRAETAVGRDRGVDPHWASGTAKPLRAQR